MIPERFRPVLDATGPLAAAFDAAGHRLYLVGGVVRDLLLGEIESTDYDFTTDATPDETLAVIRGMGHVDDGGPVEAVWTQGQRFGTIGARIVVDGRSIDHEITTHRAESYDETSRKPEVSFATDIEADLSRRDFTVNAMALSLPDAQLVDPFGGTADLAAKVLRTPLSPEASFSDDPLRMLRAARFLTRYELKPDAELVAAVESMADRLAIVSAERIRDELSRLLVLDDPSLGLWFLADTGLAEHFLPELPEMRVEQDPIHRHKDVLAHTIAVVRKTSPTLVLRLSALLHDIGKPKTRAIGENGVSFHHHEVVGARMARKRMKALKFPNDVIEDVGQLVFLHLRFHGYGDDAWTDAAVRRYVRDAGHLLDELNELTRCDCTTRNKRKADMLARRMDALEARIARLREEEELAAIRPDLDGKAVMDILGIGPGRDVGRALQFLLELRMDEGPLDPADAESRLRAWWASDGGD